MYDVIIIGAGVTGAAAARELSRYKLSVCVLEKEEDVCCGTSKANSAIVHAGFDAETGTLKARFNVRGSEMMEELARDLDIPYKRNGAMVVCINESEKDGLRELYERGVANGVKDLRILDRQECLFWLIRFMKAEYPGMLPAKYDIDVPDDLPEGDVIREIARVKNLFLPGAEPDRNRAERLLFDDFKNGRIGRVTLDRPAPQE